MHVLNWCPNALMSLVTASKPWLNPDKMDGNWVCLGIRCVPAFGWISYETTGEWSGGAPRLIPVIRGPMWPDSPL